MTLTMDTIAVRDETLTAAAAAAHDYIAEWKAKTGGNAYVLRLRLGHSVS